MIREQVDNQANGCVQIKISRKDRGIKHQLGTNIFEETAKYFDPQI